MESSGKLLSSRLLSLLKNGQWERDDVVKLFKVLVNEFKGRNEDFHTWMMKILHQVEIHKIQVSELNFQNGDKIVDQIKAKINDTKEKSLENIVKEISEQSDIDKEMMAQVTDIVSSVNHSLAASTEPHLQGIKQSLFKLCKAVEKTQKYKPRVTQMVSWCILVLSKSSRLVQVLTGEGKSCIVAMFAAYQVMMGKTPDIISSSPVLAERDAKEWSAFYKELNITVDVNTNKSEDEELKKCYECQVVYGTTNDFAGDFLRQCFHRKDVRPKREFQCVIVDEVDSLMLDKGLEVVYLNSNMPLMEPLNELLAEIWLIINQLKRLETGEILGPVQLFSQVLSEIITEDKNTDQQMAVDGAKQLDNASVDQTEAFLNMFVMKFPEYFFKLYQEGPDGNLQNLKEISPTGTNGKPEISVLLLGNGKCRLVHYEENSLVKSLGKIIKKCLLSESKEQNESCIPGLQDLINGKLHTWIENALLATKLTLGHEYIFHGDGVVPVDYKCTGVVQNNMRWGEGLQQFLEMKHQTKLSNMTLITNFMSNVGLFKKYSNQIYGITGTLGDQTELDMLKKLYSGIDTWRIPSFRRRKLYELEGLVIPEEDEWIRTVCDVVQDQVTSTVYRGQRAALVICETIKRAEMFHKSLSDTISLGKLKLYVNNNMDNSTITDSTIQAGDIIVATNLAGRGTDLKVCESVNEAGGLFVVQTFLPLNVRVEQQAFGRTARQGSPGSAQLIMCASHFSDSVKLVMGENTSLLSRLNNLTTTLMSHLTSILMPRVSTEGLFEEAVNNYPINNSSRTHVAMVSALKSLLTVKSVRFMESNLEKAKDARNILVKIRLSRFLDKDTPKIIKKEELFAVYLKVLDGVYEDDVFSDQCDVIVPCLHECWGLWLLMNFSEKKNLELMKEHLMMDLSSAKQKLLSRQSPSSMVYYYIRSGNNLHEKGCLTESIEMFTKALEDGASREIIPLYNRALATIKKKDTGYIAQALADLIKAGMAVDSYKSHLAKILTYVKLSSQETNVDGKNLLTKQFRVKFMIVDLLKMNIQDSVIKLKRVESRGGNARLLEKHTVFLAEGLMKCAISTQISPAEIFAIVLIDDFITRAEIKQDGVSLAEKFAKFWAENFMKRTGNRGDVNPTERLSSRRTSSFLPDGSLVEDTILSSVRVLKDLLMEFEHIMYLGLDTIFSLETISVSIFSGLFSKMFKQS